MASKPSKVPELGPKGLVFDVDGEMAYMALLDVASYDKELQDWEYESLTKKIVSEMNAGHIVAWGCPEVELSIQIVNELPAKSDLAERDASFSALLKTEGLVCLASYTSLTMCAEYEDETFPQELDHAFRVPPGTYRVDVHRLFAHQDGEQAPEDEDTEEDYRYVIVLSAPSKDWEPPPQSWVPWAETV